VDSQTFVRLEVILNPRPADGVAVYERLMCGHRHEGDFQAFA